MLLCKKNIRLIYLIIFIACLTMVILGTPHFNERPADANSFEQRNTTSLQGDGTSTNPYLINNKNDLDIMRNLISNNSEINTQAHYFALKSDIDLSGGIFAPIPNFGANFLGNNNIIYNFAIQDNNADNIGFFRSILNGGRVVELGLAQISIIESNNNYIGSIAGINNGTIENSFAIGEIFGSNYVGGIVGQNNGRISNTNFIGSLEANSLVGGLVGDNASTNAILENSYTYSSLSVNTQSYIGAVAGNKANGAVLKNTYYNNYKNLFKGIGEINGFGSDFNTQVKGLDLYQITGTVANMPELAQDYVVTPNHMGQLHLPKLKGFAQNVSLSTANLKDIFNINLFDYSNIGITDNWGTEVDPFIINSIEQLNNLSYAVSRNINFNSSYFRLNTDLDFINKNFTPIGSKETPFRGTFDGNNKKIRNLIINLPQNDYVGLFGYIRNGELKDLNIENSCSFTGNNYVGSFAGFAEGRLSRLSNFAKVTASQFAGGIVGYGENLSLSYIVNTVPTSAIYANGIVGSVKQNVTTNRVVYLNSDKNYKHDGIGTLLNIDNISDCTVTRNGENIELSAAVKNGYFIEFRDENNNLISNSATFTLNSNPKVLNLKYTLGVSFSYTNSLISISNISNNSATYYVGQNVVLTISLLTQGYYINGISINNNGEFVLTNDGSNILLSFTMQENYSSITVTTQEIVADNMEKTYDKKPFLYTEVNGLPPNYTYIVQYSGKEPPIDAGSHTVSIQIVNENDIIVGSIEKQMTINALAVSFSLESVHKLKEFDDNPSAFKVDTLSHPISIKNLCQGDDVSITVKITFDNQSIGINKNGVATFELTGKNKNNYSIVVSESFSDGEITKRTLIIAIDNPDNLTKIYDGLANIPTHSYDKNSLGEFSLLSNFNKILPIFTLTNIDDPTDLNTFNVGRYSLSVRLERTISGDDTGYYNVVLKQPYVMTVLPKKVSLTYSDYENLIYKDQDYAIKGAYKDVNKITQYATFEYFSIIDGELSNISVIPRNAGFYRAIPTIDKNYIVSGDNISGVLFQDFSIAKAEQSDLAFETFDQKIYGDIAFDLSLADIGSGDGKLSIEILQGESLVSYIQNGEVFNITIIGAGDIQIVLTRATSLNYLEKTAEVFAFTIDKKEINLILNDLSIKYSETMTFTYDFDALVNGDTLPYSFVEPTLSIEIEGAYQLFNSNRAYDANNKNEFYNIKMNSDATSRDYSFVYPQTPAKLYIEKVKVTITVLPTSHIYGETDAIINFSSQTENGDVIIHGKDCCDGLCPFINSLERDKSSNNFGIYVVLTEKFIQDNSKNSDINMINNGNLYSIEKRDITLSAVNKDKNYKETDPTAEFTFNLIDLAYDDTISSVISGVMSRISGEDAYFGGENNFIRYEYNIGSLSPNDNYKIIFVKGYLTIHRIHADVSVESANFMIQYGDLLKSVNPDINSELTGQFIWNDPNFLPVNNGEYEGNFVPSNKSYYPAPLKFKAIIIKRKINVTFTHKNVIYYNGVEQKPISYSFDNVLPNDDLKAELTYDKKVFGIGSYTAKVAIGNDNYEIDNKDFLIFTIEKAPLTIKIEDIDIDQGQTPIAKFIYSGFVGGENENDLIALPTVNLPTTPGNHKIKPSGAKSDNYNIIYEESNLYIKRTNLASDDFNVSIDGRFDNDMVVAVSEILKGSNSDIFLPINEKFEEFKATQSGKLAKSKLQRLYKMEFSIRNDDAELNQKVKVKIELPSKLREAKYHNVIVIDKEGNLKLVENCVREGNYLIFETDTLDYVGIVNPPDYTYLILGIGLAVAFILVLSLDVISEKLGLKKKRANKKLQKNAQPPQPKK